MTASGVISPELLMLLAMEEDRVQAFKRWWAWKKPEGAQGVLGAVLVVLPFAEDLVESDVGIEISETGGGRQSKGLHSRSSGAAFGVSWSMGVDGHNLSVLVHLRTAEWREKEADFECERDSEEEGMVEGEMVD